VSGLVVPVLLEEAADLREDRLAGRQRLVPAAGAADQVEAVVSPGPEVDPGVVHAPWCPGGVTVAVRAGDGAVPNAERAPPPAAWARGGALSVPGRGSEPARRRWCV
jgi:hypothetical protein